MKAHPRSGDVLIMLLVAVAEIVQALAITTSSVNDDVVAPAGLARWALVTLSPLCLLIRRNKPLLALSIGTITTMTAWILDLPTVGLVAMFVLYGAVTYGPKKVGLRAACTSAFVLFAFTMTGFLAGEAAFYVLPLVAWTVTLPILAGVNQTTNRELLALTQAQLIEIERRRSVDEATAIQAERARMARELHDVVAHGLSVIVIQTGAASRLLKTADCDDLAPTVDRVAGIVDTIDGAARRSLQDMRQVLGVLREPTASDAGSKTPGSWQPTPGATNISELVVQARSEGLEVTLKIDGDPVEIPAVVGASAYRITQEALTNVRKHGGPGVKAQVMVTIGVGLLEVVVDDNGRGASTLPDEVNSADAGHGLIGMRERTELLGGEFSAGPRTGGGFSVRANLPFALDPTAK